MLFMILISALFIYCSSSLIIRDQINTIKRLVSRLRKHIFVLVLIVEVGRCPRRRRGAGAITKVQRRAQLWLIGALQKVVSAGRD